MNLIRNINYNVINYIFNFISIFNHRCLSGPRVISTLLIDPTQVESKKSSQIQWPVPSINAELVEVFLEGE